MTPAIRRFLAFLSACAIAASILAYIYSFFGAPADRILPWVVLLALGWMALFVPIYFLESPASRKWDWSLKEWARGLPAWVAPCSWLLQLIFIAHLCFSAVQTWPGAPAIVDGQYVLDSAGRILKVLTRAEYIRLMQAELRVFATLMISFYFVPLTYWWFRKSPPEASATPNDNSAPLS